MKKIEEYLERNNKKIGCICSFDRNGNEYNHEFFFCDDGESDHTAWDLEIRKMEDVITMQLDIEEAIDMGLTCLDDFYNYEDEE